MIRTAFVLLTLLCFTGCTTLQPLAAQPATIEQPSSPADGVPLEQSDTPPAGDGTSLWVTLGVLALIVVVVAVASDDGGGGGY